MTQFNEWEYFAELHRRRQAEDEQYRRDLEAWRNSPGWPRSPKPMLPDRGFYLRDHLAEIIAIASVPTLFGLAALTVWAADAHQAQKDALARAAQNPAATSGPNVVQSPPAAESKPVDGAGSAQFEMAQALLAEPGSPYYAQEFEVAGSRAIELATDYVELMMLFDPAQTRFTSLPKLEEFRAWQRSAGYLPASNEDAAFCLVLKIAALQASVGLVPMDSPQHPLYGSSFVASPEVYAARSESCGR